MSDGQQVTLWGIPNCDTVRKARAWLTANDIAYRFCDFRKDGLPAAVLEGWIGSVGWEALVNRRGTTWRGLDDARKARITDGEQAALLMLELPAVIKRPVLQAGTRLLVGLDDALYQSHFFPQSAADKHPS